MSTSTSTTPKLPITSGAPVPSLSGPPPLRRLAPAIVYSPEEMTSTLRDLTLAVTGIRTFLASSYGPPPMGSFAPALPPQQPTWPPASSPATWGQVPPVTAQGVPITQIRFPPSPSLLPDCFVAPVYTIASGQPSVPAPPALPSVGHFNGPLGYTDPSTSALGRHEEAYSVPGNGQPPPRYSKMDFAPNKYRYDIWMLNQYGSGGATWDLRFRIDVAPEVMPFGPSPSPSSSMAAAYSSRNLLALARYMHTTFSPRRPRTSSNSPSLAPTWA